MSYSVGIDIGTTYTAASVSVEGGVEIVGLGAVANAVPTAIHVSPTGEISAAESAMRNGAADPDGLVQHFKRRLGDTVPIRIRDQSMHAHELLSEMIVWARTRVAELQGGEPKNVVLTHPADWGQLKKDLFVEAAARAGVHDAHLITEPEAAAIHYAAQERLPDGALVAIYDLGGGTFDATLLRKAEQGFDFVGEPLGSDRVGGVDFDDRLWGHVVETAGGFEELDLNDSAVRRQLARLRRDSVGLKEALSAETSALLNLTLGGGADQIRVTRSEFEEVIRPSLEDSIAAVERLLRANSITQDEVHSVLLVGGSSRIPLVGELVTRALGRPVALDVHPKFAVANGAARYAREATALDVPVESDSSAVTTRSPMGVGETHSEREDPAGVDSSQARLSPGEASIKPDEGQSRVSRRLMTSVGAVAVIIVGAIAFAAIVDEEVTTPGPSNPGFESTVPPSTIADSDATTSSSPSEDLPAISAYQPSLDRNPLVWLDLLPPALGGPADYFELFDSSSREDVFTGIDVLTLKSAWVSDLGSSEASASDLELASLLAALSEQTTAVGVQTDALPDSNPCGGEALGFADPAGRNRIAERIAAIGGKMHFLTLSNPYSGGALYEGPNACGWTAEEIAREVAAYVEEVRSLFPDVVVGTADTFGGEPDDLADWLEAYELAVGEGLGYVHLLVDFNDPTWTETAIVMGDVASSHGVEFGVVFDGPDDAVNDTDWVSGLVGRVDTLQLLSDGDLDHTVVSGDGEVPRRLLPASVQGTLTNWLVSYRREPTFMEINIRGREVSGVLAREDGSPVPSEQVELSLTPLGEQGVVADYTITGTVPEGVQFADAGYRINIECDCSVPAELTLFEVTYTEAGSEGNLIPNPDFSDGLEGWDPFGEASIEITSSGGQVGLHLEDRQAQGMGLNSPRFDVVAGRAFTATFTAEVVPISTGAGYFSLVFQRPSGEITRFTAPLEPGTAVFSTAITDSNGSWSATIPSTFDPPYLIEARYEGNRELTSSVDELLVDGE